LAIRAWRVDHRLLLVVIIIVVIIIIIIIVIVIVTFAKLVRSEFAFLNINLLLNPKR